LSASYAVVAAPTFNVDAPCDGVVSQVVSNFGVLPAGASLGSVKPTPLDDPAQRAAQAELETSRADAEALKRLITLAEDMRQKVGRRSTILTERRGAHLEQLFQQASLNEAKQQAAVDGAATAEKRALDLCEQNLMTQLECDALRAKAEVERKQLEAATGEKTIARFLLESRRLDADVGDAVGSEVTYARALGDDLSIRLATLKQQLETREAQVSALERRLNPPDIGLVARNRSRVARAMYADGARVVKGRSLFQMADCGKLFVFAAVDEAVYEKLRVGAGANVNFDGKEHSGKVAALLGPYNPSSDGGFLPPPPPAVTASDASKSGVALEVPGLQAVLGANCDIGGRVRVRFER
jgi:multidrug resistance efflux pump